MEQAWGSRVRPNIEQVTSLFDNNVLGAFISGHLVIESILVQMLEVHPREGDNGRYFDWSFRRKVDASEARKIIEPRMADFLRGLNNIRNRLAHKLDTAITFQEAFDIARLAASGGVDFSDESIYLDQRAAEEFYGIEGIIQEVFQNTAQDLLFLLDDNNYLHSFLSSDYS